MGAPAADSDVPGGTATPAGQATKDSSKVADGKPDAACCPCACCSPTFFACRWAVPLTIINSSVLFIAGERGAPGNTRQLLPAATLRALPLRMAGSGLSRPGGDAASLVPGLARDSLLSDCGAGSAWPQGGFATARKGR